MEIAYWKNVHMSDRLEAFRKAGAPNAWPLDESQRTWSSVVQEKWKLETLFENLDFCFGERLCRVPVSRQFEPGEALA
jgi:hypothetical protein